MSDSVRTPTGQRPSAADFSFANDLRDVASWIIARHSVEGCREPLKTIERVQGHLCGANIEPSHDLDWLIRNDPLVAALHHHVAKAFAGRASGDATRREGDGDLASATDEEVWGFAKIFYEIPDLHYCNPERLERFRAGLADFLRRRLASPQPKTEMILDGGR